jgi:hypothetical protein
MRAFSSIAKEARPDFGGKAQLAELRKVSVTPVYLLKLKPQERSGS